MALLSYTEEYKLRESDFDGNDNIRVSALLDIFQTMAGRHALILGIGFRETLSRGLVWVITKLKYDCFRALRAGEVVSVETRPQPKGLIDYVRDYFVRDEKGELVAKATSQWVLVNFETRKISKAVMDFDGEFVGEYAYPDRRIEHVAPFSAEEKHSHIVRRSEIDHNGHTNNVRYADMCFDAAELPKGFARHVVINFLAETRLGDEILVSAKQNGNTFLFCGTHDGTPSFTAEMDFDEE